MLLILAATGLLQRFGDLIVVGLVLALAAYGGHFGLFLAVLAAMHALASLVVALAFATPLASVLMGLEVPGTYAFPAAFGALFVGVAVAIRLAVGELVPADVVRFRPAIDKVGGGCMGALAGFMLAGAVLIASSMVPLPEALRIDGSKLRFDAGTRLLRTFARCVEPDDAARELLIQGEPPTVAEAAPVSPACSELYADVDNNDQFDDGEPYLDEDGNGSFTLQLPYVDANGNGRRDVGILERYRLGAWRNAKVLYAPTIDAPSAVEVPTDTKEGDVVYQIVAVDMDPDETFAYAMRIESPTPAAGQTKAGDASSDYHDTDLLSIDKVTGAVKMADPQGFATRRPNRLQIVVSVTDSHGLKTEKTVTLNRKVVKTEGGRPGAAAKP